jgi:ferredoxin-type protein NapG
VDIKRRDFLIRATQAAAVAACGGLAWAHLLRQASAAAPLAIRPPGALMEADFAALCIKCGQCADACPYDTLKMATADAAVPIGTPYYIPRDIPCYMCVDIPCKAACPTGALDPGLDDINASRMGLAVIDEESCLSWQGLRCEICYRECPVTGKAITVDKHPRLISKHAMFVPIVHSEHCTGCGICEKACPTQEAAIRVVNPKWVQGKIGEHYRLGWKREDAITQEFKPAETPTQAQQPSQEVAPKTAPGMDVLNEGIE